MMLASSTEEFLSEFKGSLASMDSGHRSLESMGRSASQDLNMPATPIDFDPVGDVSDVYDYQRMLRSGSRESLSGGVGMRRVGSNESFGSVGIRRVGSSDSLSRLEYGMLHSASTDSLTRLAEGREANMMRVGSTDSLACMMRVGSNDSLVRLGEGRRMVHSASNDSLSRMEFLRTGSAEPLMPAKYRMVASMSCTSLMSLGDADDTDGLESSKESLAHGAASPVCLGQFASDGSFGAIPASLMADTPSSLLTATAKSGTVGVTASSFATLPFTATQLSWPTLARRQPVRACSLELAGWHAALHEVCASQSVDVGEVWAVDGDGKGGFLVRELVHHKKWKAGPDAELQTEHLLSPDLCKIVLQRQEAVCCCIHGDTPLTGRSGAPIRTAIALLLSLVDRPGVGYVLLLFSIEAMLHNRATANALVDQVHQVFGVVTKSLVPASLQAVPSLPRKPRAKGASALPHLAPLGVAATMAALPSAEPKRAVRNSSTQGVELEQYINKPLKQSARELGISPATLRRMCRDQGMKRWPYRSLKQLDREKKRMEQGDGEVMQLGQKLIEMKRARLLNLPQPAHAASTAAASSPSKEATKPKEPQEPQTSVSSQAWFGGSALFNSDPLSKALPGLPPAAGVTQLDLEDFGAPLACENYYSSVCQKPFKPAAPNDSDDSGGEDDSFDSSDTILLQVARGLAASARTGGVSSADFKFSDWERFFHMPLRQAAEELKIGRTSLKRLCRLHGLKRWPYRTLKHLDYEMSKIGQRQQPDDEVNKLGAELLILKRKKLLQKPETYTETGTLNRLNWC